MRAAFRGRAAQRARETQTKGPGVKPPPRLRLWPHGVLVKNRGKRELVHAYPDFFGMSYPEAERRALRAGIPDVPCVVARRLYGN